jgi:hypothetical protein
MVEYCFFQTGKKLQETLKCHEILNERRREGKVVFYQPNSIEVVLLCCVLLVHTPSMPAERSADIFLKNEIHRLTNNMGAHSNTYIVSKNAQQVCKLTKSFNNLFDLCLWMKQGSCTFGDVCIG